MNKYFKQILVFIVIPAILLSCAALPQTMVTGSIYVPEPILEPVPIIVIPPIPEYIIGFGIIPAMDMAEFLLNINPNINTRYARELAEIYVEEAAMEGINHDVAFAQMLLETGYLRFGGLVTPEMNNFAGLGSVGPGQAGLSFPEPRIGVRAQIQHLKAYASESPLNQELVNPRYFLVRLGSSPSINGLAGTWAADPQYGEKIKNILERLYIFSFERQ